VPRARGRGGRGGGEEEGDDDDESGESYAASSDGDGGDGGELPGAAGSMALKHLPKKDRAKFADLWNRASGVRARMAGAH
jgi:hypothetical protein